MFLDQLFRVMYGMSGIEAFPELSIRTPYIIWDVFSLFNMSFMPWFCLFLIERLSPWFIVPNVQWILRISVLRKVAPRNSRFLSLCSLCVHHIGTSGSRRWLERWVDHKFANVAHVMLPPATHAKSKWQGGELQQNLTTVSVNSHIAKKANSISADCDLTWKAKWTARIGKTRRLILGFATLSDSTRTSQNCITSLLVGLKLLCHKL